MNNNLLSVLYKWAHRQDENFLTEAFVHLLQSLLQIEPSHGCLILSRLTGGACKIPVAEVDLVSLTTQVTTDLGRPDIEVTTPDCLVFIEVKKESGLGHLQLERYRAQLQKRAGFFSATKLVLLTRYPITYGVNAEKPDVHIRWMEIGEWLEELQFDSEVTKFLVEQFLGFLYERGMKMEKVTWQLVEGQRSLRSLLAMVEEAISATNLSIHQRTAGWDWIGYYLEGKKAFIGFYFDEPNLLCFEAYVGRPLDGMEIDFGEVADNGTQWDAFLDLAAEREPFFFAQNKANQYKIVEEFLRKSWTYAKTLLVQS